MAIPTGFRGQWNLNPSDVKRCAVYELLRVAREELELRLYKAFELVPDEDGEDTREFKFHILHKGQMYEIIWQHESFSAYVLKDKFPDSTEFILSIRRYGTECVALVQRLRPKKVINLREMK